MVDPFADLALTREVAHIAIAMALGMFLGLEREWSQKPAGIRTFALVAVLGTILTLFDLQQCTESVCIPVATGLGGLLVVVLAGLLVYSGLLDRDESLHLTTAVSLFVAYGVGLLVALDYLLAATVAALTSSLLLVFKRELHGFAWGLSRTELRAAAEFAIIAFVIYPILPGRPVEIPQLGIAVEPRVVWLMVVFVAGVGIVNYAVAREYGPQAVAITGFFGGLASSTAVVGSMLEHVRSDEEAIGYASGAVLLAISAMALRNLVLAAVFTDPSVFLTLVAPLGVIVLGGVLFGIRRAASTDSIELDLESPFSLKYALAFGAVFAFVTVAGTVAQAQAGSAGLLVTTFVSGFVSSAGATTSVVVLFRSGAIGTAALTLGVLLATAASVLVKVGLVAASPNRAFARDVVIRVTVLLVLAVAVAIAIV